MFMAGIVVFLAGLFFFIQMGASYDSYLLSAFLDWPTIFAFIVVIASIIVATGGFRTFVVAVNALLSKKYNISAADKEKAVRLFQLLGKSVIYASVLFVVIGVILILHNLADPSSLGPSVAVALCAIFQGAAINLVLINPAIHVLQTRYNTEEKTVISEKQVIDKLLELCYRQGISPEDIMDAKEIVFKKQQ